MLQIVVRETLTHKPKHLGAQEMEGREGKGTERIRYLIYIYIHKKFDSNKLCLLEKNNIHQPISLIERSYIFFQILKRRFWHAKLEIPNTFIWTGI